MSALVSQTRFESRIYWRNRSGVFFTFVLPLILLALVGGLGGDGEVNGLPYREFVIPGLVAIAIVSTTFQSLAIALAFHREQGVLKQLRATPLSPVTLIASKIATVGIVAIIEMFVIVMAARVFFDVQGPEEVGAFFLVSLVGCLAFSALGIVVSNLAKHGESSPAITNAIYLPMMMLSGVFFAVQELPGWLQFVVKALPLYHLVVPIRASFTGYGDVDLLQHLAVLILWGAGAAIVATKAFRWQPGTSV